VGEIKERGRSNLILNKTFLIVHRSALSSFRKGGAEMDFVVEEHMVKDETKIKV
jgi:hypothetical protein